MKMCPTNIAAVAALCLLTTAAYANPSISIYADWEDYSIGEEIGINLAAENGWGNTVPVDVYLGLLADDTIYCLSPTGWVEGIVPWLVNFQVTPFLDVDRYEATQIETPCDIPPVDAPGEYFLAAGMTYTTTFQFTSDISVTSVVLHQSGTLLNNYYVDGEIGDDGDDGSSTAPFKTITKALSVAEGNEFTPAIIRVAKGSYSPSSNGETFPLQMKSHLVLEGQETEETTLFTEGETAVVFDEGVHDSRISYFTISGSSSPDSKGGAIYCYRSSPQITHNYISDNTAGYGAAIYIEEASPHVIFNDIRYNGGELGAPIHVTGRAVGIPYLDEEPVWIWGNWILHNYGFGDGGAISICDGAIVDVDGNIIDDNFSNEGPGGAIFCVDSVAAVHGCNINGNTANGDGGGIFVQNSTVSIRRNWIDGNWGEQGGGVYLSGSIESFSDNYIGYNMAQHSGGGVFLGEGTHSIHNNLIEANGSYDGGDGVYCAKGPQVVFSNNTLVGNYTLSMTQSHGGAMHYEDGDGLDTLQIFNCIFWDNEDDLHGCSAIYSCIEDGDEGEGNLMASPLFVTNDPGNPMLGFPEDYYLDPDSPCVDAGNMTAEEAGLDYYTTRTDRQTDSGVVDLGFHYPLLLHK